jgi:AraC-like DNA-binding protein
MRDPTQFPLITPDVLLGSAPLRPPAGPVRLALDEAPERDRPALLQHGFARFGFHYQVHRLPDVPFGLDVAINALPGLFVAAGRIHGSRTSRTRALVEQDDADDIGLVVNLAGPHLIAQGSDEIVLGDGEAAFMSCADPCSYTHKLPSHVLVMRFPKARFAPLVNGIQDRYLQRIPRGAPVLKLLTDYVGVAWDAQANASRELQHLMVAHVYDLMALMVGATRDAEQAAQGRGLHAARLHAIKQDIAANLARPELSVRVLADRHGCTERFVQRLFEAEGTTFTDYVLAQRLARAHRLLTDPRRAAEKISAAAFDAGFGDVSYFNRAFRRHFGATPSDVRAQASGEG